MTKLGRVGGGSDHGKVGRSEESFGGSFGRHLDEERHFGDVMRVLITKMLWPPQTLCRHGRSGGGAVKTTDFQYTRNGNNLEGRDKSGASVQCWT